MPWDPLGTWPGERRWIWLSICAWVILLRGPAFVESVRTTGDIVPDFFQEYASARNWFEGLPIYADHHETVPRYLGVSLNDKRSHVFVNAHPPTSVLLAIPFAKLDFAGAFLAWNLVSLAALAASLWIVQRGLIVPFSLWSFAPLVSLLLLCHPVWEQSRLGQLTLVLLVLVTGAWAAGRSGRPWLAGTLLGTATAIELFPAFLCWKVLIAGLLVIAGLSGLTAIVLGIDAYRSYIFTVLPEIKWFRVGWNNDSLWGFWSRLFDPAPERERTRSLTEPLFYSPALAKALFLNSSSAIVAVLAWTARRDPKGQRCDLTSSQAATAILLVSPICWDHYLLLMLVPLAVVWMELPASRFARVLYLVIVAASFMGYPLVWTAFGLNARKATPVESVGVLSYQYYALLGLFGLVLVELRPNRPNVPSVTTARHALALGAVVMAALWVQVVYASWRDYGLFYYLGGDFGIYRSIAQAVLAEGPRAMHDLDLVAPLARERMPYSGFSSHGLRLGPRPYPAVYILPLLGLTLCAPPAGYLIWSLMGAAMAFAVVRGMAARVPERGWGLDRIGDSLFPGGHCALFRPVDDGVRLRLLSHLSVIGRRPGLPSRSLERHTCYLKPQFAVFVFLVFLFKRRWRSLSGLVLAGFVVLLGSAAIVGPEGLRAYLVTLRSMSGFRDVMPIVFPRIMMNWRELLVNFLPEDVSELTGQLVTLILSLLSTATLFLIWRGEWKPRNDRFPIQVLATVIVMMLASYHNHIHSGALLLVPGLAAAASKDSPRFLRTVLLLGLYAPLPLLFVTGSTMRVAWLYIALMLAALGIIVRAELASLVQKEKLPPASDALNAQDLTRGPADHLATT